ncbi:MAG: DUF6175 family protein [Paludibacter sp.]
MKKLKGIIITLFALILSVSVFSQAKRPTIMVVPSDNWCVKNNFITVFDNMGSTIKIPDYRKALQESAELLNVISKINEMMTERGFPLKNLESAMKSMQNQSAEDAMLSSKTGADINESPIDKLKKVAKADIIMQLTWSVNQTGPRRSITFNLQGIDAYTDKQIAGASGTGQPSFSAELPVLLEEAVLAHIDNFNAQLQKHFDDLFANGREVSLRITTFSSFNGDLENEYGGIELSEIIENWVSDNTVKNRFSLSDATENTLLFEQVRIPLYDANNRPVDTRGWARDLQKMLADRYRITAKLMTRGLGQAQLVIGEK